MRGDDATSSISSMVQSIGSTELMRIFSIEVCRRTALNIPAKLKRGVNSFPHRPRLMPDRTISR